MPIVWSHETLRSCTDIGVGASAEGGGVTRFEVLSSGHEGARLQNVRIEMTSFSWPHETAAETQALRRGYEATLRHEIGHVRTAIASVVAVNERTIPFERIEQDQLEYDRATDHGLRQSALRPPLGGPNTVVTCPSR